MSREDMGLGVEIGRQLRLEALRLYDSEIEHAIYSDPELREWVRVVSEDLGRLTLRASYGDDVVADLRQARAQIALRTDTVAAGIRRELLASAERIAKGVLGALGKALLFVVQGALA